MSKETLPIPNVTIPVGHSLAARYETHIQQARDAFLDGPFCVFCGEDVTIVSHEIVVGYVPDLTSIAQQIDLLTKTLFDGSTAVCWKRPDVEEV